MAPSTCAGSARAGPRQPHSQGTNLEAAIVLGAVEYLDDNALNVYTDGSCLSKPRQGGMGIRFVTNDEAGEEKVDDYCLSGHKGATNNQMELKACTEALGIALAKGSAFDLSRYRKIVIFTDSTYVEQNIRNALFVWPTTGWTTKDGPPVEHVGLWKALTKKVHASPLRVEFKWIPGKRSRHAKAVDRLAKQSANAASQPNVAPVKVRRKKSPQSVDRGSVGMDGQRATIHISEDKLVRVRPPYYRYRYSVLSQDSPYFEQVDFIYSELLLGAGHSYDVRFNTDQKHPRIEELFEEIEG